MRLPTWQARALTTQVLRRLLSRAAGGAGLTPAAAPPARARELRSSLACGRCSLTPCCRSSTRALRLLAWHRGVRACSERHWGAMPSSFESAVVAHAAASAAALMHSLKPGATPTAGLARLLWPPTPSTVGAVLLGNAGVSVLMLLSLALKHVFLGNLSVIESQNATEKAISWLLLKLVTLAALEAEPDALELLAWAIWFAALGVLTVFFGLARDRFERLSAAPSTTGRQHARTLSLLLLLLVADAACVRFVLRVFSGAGGVTLCLLLHDTLTLGVSALLLAVRYSAHLYEVALFQADGALPSGEHRRSVLFCVDFVAETCTDLLSLYHSVVLFWLHGLSLSLVDSILLLHLRALTLGFMQRVTRFVGFLVVSRDLQRMYTEVPAEELAARQEDCAICRERLDRAKRLPCGHAFHTACLRGWLEIRTQCPCCRAPLTDR